MRNILLIDDGNPIAQGIGTLCRKQNFNIDIFRDGENDFKINEINTNPDLFLQRLKRKKYDAMLLAPMHFSYDGDVTEDGDITKEFDQMVNINLKLPMLLMSLGPKIVKKGGVILNLLSTDYQWGSFASKNYSAVMMAKKSYIKSYANLLGKYKIRVNGVAVGWTEDVIEESDTSSESLAQMDKKALEYTPLSRKGSVSEIAKVFKFLLSKESSYINGQTLIVDGGYGNVDIVTKCEYESGDFKVV